MLRTIVNTIRTVVGEYECGNFVFWKRKCESKLSYFEFKGTVRGTYIVGYDVVDKHQFKSIHYLNR